MKSLALILALTLSSSAFAWTSSFGSEGRDGSNGRDGDSGRSGQSVLIQAHLSGPQSYYLDGGDAGHASPGYDGDHATSCYQRLEENDMEGADGGDGGKGGNGGRGGDGGDATIYYTDAAQLKKILIFATGGRGGEASWGGRGGEPCRCTETRWVVPRCREVVDQAGNKQRICDQQDTYVCRDGDRGRDGAPGTHGSEGSLGYVTLIKSKTPLQSENTHMQVSLKQFGTNRVADAVLTENLFTRSSGMLSLLAPGSRVSDTFTEFVRRAVENVRVVWDSKKPASSYSGRISASISNGAVSFNVDTSEVLLTEQRLENGVHTLYIRDAYNLSEFAILGITMEGKKKDTVVRIKGASPRLDLVSDSVHVTVSRKRLLFGHKEVFSRIVDSTYIQKVGSDLVVNVGKLPVIEPEDTWKDKKEVKIEVSIVRRVRGSDETIERKAVFFNEQK